jgi:hypothetical protein
MGSRRLGRKRLFALEKLGQTQTKTAGAGMIDSVGNCTETRNASEIITEIEIDLAPAAGAAHSFAADKAIGVSSSSGTHGAATIVQIDQSVHGAVTDMELICLEVPTGGDPDIDLYTNTGSVLAGAAVAGTKEINHGDWSYIGQAKATTATGLGAAATARPFVYLATGANTDADYTAGKYILRLYGTAVFDDL